MFGIDVAIPNLQKVTDDALKEVAGFATDAMRDTTNGLVQALRDQIRSAGMGARLANTWRGQTYPQSGSALNPAGYVWSKAPAIIDAYSRGAVIRPTGGRKFLWIPTKNVPRAGARVGRTGGNLRGGAMTPEELENQFNTDFIIRKGKGNRLLAFMDVIKALNAKTFRKRSKGRLKQGRPSSEVLMYVLVPSVSVAKRLDLEGEANRWAAQYPTILAARWR